MDFPTTLKERTANSKKPGRRSQPRTAEDEPGIPCDECGKEFRYDDSSSEFGKSLGVVYQIMQFHGLV